MERVALIYGSMAALAIVGAIYGYLFNKRHNHILGFEWYFLAGSAASGMLFLAGASGAFGVVWRFLDMFSRVAGVTIIGSIGLLRITHGLRTSGVMDAGMFAAGIAATSIFLASPALMEIFIYVVYGSTLFFFAIIAIMAWRCLRSGHALHAVGLACVIAMNTWVGTFPEILEFGEDGLPIHLLEFVAAHLVWAASFAELYHAYVHLEEAQDAGKEPDPAEMGV